TIQNIPTMARSQRKRPVCQTSFTRMHLVAQGKSHMRPMAKLKCQQCDDSSPSDLLSTHPTKRHPRENATPIAAVAFSADLNAMPLQIPATRRPAIRITPSNTIKRSPCENTTTIAAAAFSEDLNAMPLDIPASRRPAKRSHCENTTTPATVTFSTDLNAMPLHIPAVRRPTTRTPPSNTKPSAFSLAPKPLSHNILRVNNSVWGVTCNPNPSGLPPFDPDTSSTESMDQWLEAFWPGYIGTELRQAPGDSARAGMDNHPSDLDVRSGSKGTPLARLDARSERDLPRRRVRIVRTCGLRRGPGPYPWDDARCYGVSVRIFDTAY
ncbi:hypothetical protein BJ912DRAFT_948273, partial [Pholiota molesta]